MKAALEALDERRPVWVALSDLFLDTELQESDFTRIAAVLAESPYSSEQLERILFAEVYPVCIWNMCCVAGEWAGFDSAWLEDQIVRRERRRARWPVWLQTSRWMVRSDWQHIKHALGAMRKDPC